MRYDVVLAAAVLHHLRDEQDWEAVLAGLFNTLRPGGGLWIVDLVDAQTAAAKAAADVQFADYLKQLGGETLCDEVLAYIAKEDSPRPLVWQLELMRRVGFESLDVLHKHGPFAAYGGTTGAGSSCTVQTTP